MRTLATIFLLCAALVSCQKETMLDVVVDFEYAVDGDFNTAPLTVRLTNNTTGADSFEWEFEGGDPAQSKERTPQNVTFTAPGEHRIVLRARNHDAASSKELIVRVDPAVNVRFGTEILVNDFAPVQTAFTNSTTGASSFEWTFEGGQPASSTSRDPGVVLFHNEGEHVVRLRVWNGSEYFETAQTIAVKPALQSGFTVSPAVVSEDWEAPFTAVVTNTSSNFISVLWSAPEGIVKDANAEQTTILFERPGTYTVTLTADNRKEQKSAQRQITVKSNSGIYTVSGAKFGTSRSQMCFFSATDRRVLKPSEIANGAQIEVGFFALNSDFDHCLFFSPDAAAANGLPAIANAITTQIYGGAITQAEFESIATNEELAAYFSTEAPAASFSLDVLPRFSFFATQDGRRGIVMIREVVRNGAESYIAADIKIEKWVKD